MLKVRIKKSLIKIIPIHSIIIISNNNNNKLLQQHRQYQHPLQQECHHYMYRSSHKKFQQSLQQQLYNNEINNVNISRESQKYPTRNLVKVAVELKLMGLLMLGKKIQKQPAEVFYNERCF